MRNLFRYNPILPSILIFFFSGYANAQTEADKFISDTTALTRTREFEVLLETLREKYSIPSISAGVVKNKIVIWKKGFGYADIENKIVPDENTIYHLASITKTFGFIILMQLVEQEKVKLADPVTQYNIHLGARWNDDPRIHVKHLLTHTAQGNSFNGFKPGYTFRYNGDYYSQIGKVIGKASGNTFAELVVDHIIIPLRLSHTGPTVDDSVNFNLTGYDAASFRKALAKPYDYDKRKQKIVSIPYPIHFSPAAGLMSCVTDLATYSNAIDDKMFLSSSTWEQIFTPTVTKRGKVLPYGLGWFVRSYKGVKYVWHTGWWQGSSSLIIKVPEKNLTFIVLANSQDLSRPFYARLPIYFRRSLNKNLRASAFARAFIQYFVEQQESQNSLTPKLKN